jgi:Ricin-type beta-trefoil lectin domain
MNGEAKRRLVPASLRARNAGLSARRSGRSLFRCCAPGTRVALAALALIAYSFQGRRAWGEPGQGFGRPTGNVVLKGTLVSRGSKKCLDVERGSTQSGARIVQMGCSSVAGQVWNFVQMGGDRYAIVNQGSGKVLDVAGGSTNGGANVQQSQWGRSPSQTWRIRKHDAGYYEVINDRSGKCLDVYQGKKEDGTRLIQYQCNGDANQLWGIGIGGIGGRPPLPGGGNTAGCSSYQGGALQACFQGGTLGAQDRTSNLSRNPRRYLGKYDLRYQTAFDKGYYAGWDNVRPGQPQAR